MKNYNLIILILIIFLINSCSGKKKTLVIEEKDLDLQMISAYTKGVEALDENDAIRAAKHFNEAEILFPQSEWAPKSALMAGYAFYTQNYYGDAIFELERLIKTYPTYKALSYAHFLLGICHYESIIDEQKDIEPILKAKKQFELVINKYPDTDFALDSKFKLNLIFDMLASKEMYLAKYYFEKEKWIPAINRYKTVVNYYSETIYIEEALHRLVEIHYMLGLKDEAKKYAHTLGYNYQTSKWYEESYNIFDKAKKKKLSSKKEKKNILKKFKGLLD
jgi:outer membrane protein assembly factor BamD